MFGALLLEFGGAALALLDVGWIAAVPEPDKSLLPILLTYWLALLLFVVALLLSMVGQTARAVRDMARSSFR